MTWVFVYGTLRTRGAAAGRLADAVAFRRPAVLAGYALVGRSQPYPFVVPDPTGAVVGEALRLIPDRADALLVELDRYEGDEYRRTCAPVVVGDETVVAQFWEAADSAVVEGLDRIESGDWFDR